MNTFTSDRPRRTVLRADRLFDGTALAAVPVPAVLLDGGRIAAVGRLDALPADAEVVDLPGATILPGLVDTHVHLCFDASPDPVGALAARDDEALRAALIRAGRTALRGGVTTVRDLGDRGYATVELRGGGAEGLPTIVAAGPPLTTSDGHCHYLGGVVEPDAEAARRAVREHVERGVDVIKIMASGGNLTPGTRQHEVQFPAEVLRAAVDEAHRHGLPVTAHAHASQAIADALAAGVDGLEHVTFWTEDSVEAPEDLLKLLASRRAVVGATAGTVPQPGMQPPPQVVARLPKIYANFARMYELGVPMVVGTDAGIGPIKPHDVLRRAPEDMVRIGMGAAEALRTITSVAAEVCGLGHRKGRVAPGYDADLLVVSGDPLADLAALREVRAVFAGGVAVDLSDCGD